MTQVVQSIPTIEKSIKEVKFITAIRLRFCNLSGDDIEPLAEVHKISIDATDGRMDGWTDGRMDGW